MEDTIEDIDMDDSSIIRRPRDSFAMNTPSMSSEDCSQELPSTPPNASTSSADVYGTPDRSKKLGVDRNLFTRQKIRFTSTPLFMDRLSNTLPNQLVSKFPLLDENRQCKSALNMQAPASGSEEIPVEYVNPFTPDGEMLVNKVKAQNRLLRLSLNPVGREIDLSDEPEENQEDAFDVDMPSRSRLSEFNVLRFQQEFITLGDIGKGNHGCVYKCLNRINGCIYAVKRTIKPVLSSTQERFIRNEIYAHGVLDHPNIVRNFSSWKEDDYVYIQNEFCNGGSLDTYVTTNKMSESTLLNFLLQMAQALKYMHKSNLAHLDIKPGNIFLNVCTTDKENNVNVEGEFDDNENSVDIIFKLGDLGHVTKLDEKHDVEEGDCRYLPRELITDNYQCIDRADIFSLGLTLYEVAGAGPLPKNGEEWQAIRDGILTNLPQHSEELNNLIKEMTQPEAEKRPTAAELVDRLKSTVPSPVDEELMAYINQCRNKNNFLGQTMENVGQYWQAVCKTQKQMLQEKTATKKRGAVTKTRIVGKKTKRSVSTTLF